jgi:hypothetical protein
MSALSLVRCPKCNHEFEVTDAIRHQIEESIRTSITKQIEEEYKEKLQSRLEEEERKAKLLLKREQEIQKEKEMIERARKSLDDELAKRLADEKKAIEAKILEQITEEHKLKDLEKDKKISDLMEALEKARRKASQGSQQIQGEVMELEIEDLLRREFTDDKIEEVKKGQRGADIIQRVIDKKGRHCGTILWESKNAQWSNSWISKLRDDQRQAKAELAVLVVEDAPEWLDTFVYRDRVWITKRRFVLAIATALRFDLIHIYFERSAHIGKNDKKEVLYQYLTGNEFRQRIEAIVDSFTLLSEGIEREKRFFNIKWAREEKEIRKIIDNTYGMWGELQAVTNSSLPAIKNLELESGEE